MAWWVGALLQAAPLVYGAVTSKKAYGDQSSLDASYAIANSNAIRESGRVNAASISAIGEVNAMSQLAATGSNNARIQAITDYNSDRAIFLGDYNAKLLEEEALLVLENADLSLTQMKRQHEYAIGKSKVSYASSGAIAGQDSAGLAVQDLKEQQELDEFIVRRGADVQYRKLVGQAAMSRWSGFEEANKMQLESKLLTSSNTANAVIGAAASKAQAGIDASATVYNASIKADSVFQQGMLASSSNQYKSDSSFWSGLFSAGTSLASSYIDNKARTSSSATATSLLGSNT